MICAQGPSRGENFAVILPIIFTSGLDFSSATDYFKAAHWFKWHPRTDKTHGLPRLTTQREHVHRIINKYINIHNLFGSISAPDYPMGYFRCFKPSLAGPCRHPLKSFPQEVTSSPLSRRAPCSASPGGLRFTAGFQLPVQLRPESWDTICLLCL